MGATEQRVKAGVVRDSDVWVYLESFLVCAILSMLVIRAYLRLAGYPQVGGGVLHIAHLLWGGVLMVGAIFVLLASLGRRAKQFAAVLAGIGFGFFIDELGKFITRDNNYFFRPTFGIIYVIFVALFLLSRTIAHLRPLSQREYLVNTVDMVVDLLERTATPGEAMRALVFLERSGAEGMLATSLRETIIAARRQQQARPSLVARVETAFRQWYLHSVGSKQWFKWAITAAFAADALVALLLAITRIVTDGKALRLDTRPFAEIGNLAASMLAAAMIVVGATQMLRSRHVAYRWFKSAMLVSIFVVQPYQFLQGQLNALGGLLVDLMLLVGVNYLLTVHLPDHHLAMPDREERADPVTHGFLPS